MLEQIATAQICVGPPTLPKGRYLLGLGFILTQCVVWIAASVLTQYMFQETVIESPFLMTYIGVALCVIMFPIQWLHEKWQATMGGGDTCGVEAQCSTISTVDSFDQALGQATAYQDLVDVVTIRSIQNAKTTKPWNHKKHALAALHIAPAMFLSDYAYNRGLQHTTVASSTVLVSTSCIFVLFLSVLLGVEPFRYGKLVGVLLAVVGTALTTLHDAVQQDEWEEEQAPEMHDDMDMLYGDMWSLMAAVGYAAYSVQARVLCPQDDELYSMPLLLGYVGIITSVPLLPMALYKMVSLPSISWRTAGVLLIKGLLDFVVTDYLLFRAVMLTNATVANVGLGLTIPLAFAADFIFQGIAFTTLQLAGALTVLAGFVVVNWMSSLDEAEAACASNQSNASETRPSGLDEPAEVPYKPAHQLEAHTVV